MRYLSKIFSLRNPKCRENDICLKYRNIFANPKVCCLYCFEGMPATFCTSRAWQGYGVRRGGIKVCPQWTKVCPPRGQKSVPCCTKVCPFWLFFSRTKVCLRRTNFGTWRYRGPAKLRYLFLNLFQRNAKKNKESRSFFKEQESRSLQKIKESRSLQKFKVKRRLCWHTKVCLFSKSNGGWVGTLKYAS